MKLLDEIIELATSEHGSVATLLRKCLVLAHTLKNDRLNVWAHKELDGYDPNDDDVPEYRKTSVTAKGFFIGPFGAQIHDQPIPAAALKKEHRHFANSAVLFQPIASYERVDAESKLVIEWPANLTAIYQGSFFEGRFGLNRAWQEVPGSVFVGLIDTIKTRVLRLALELKDDTGSVNDDPKGLPKEKIDQIVNNIFGGNIVIASTNFTQIGSLQIGKGDWAALAEALKTLGVQNSAISELKTALDQDSKEDTKPGLGKRAVEWLAQVGKKAGQVAIDIGMDVAKKEATKFISQYLGLPPQ
jgi:hypothetical protein